ncbi:lipopolysaccharide biosynthesis protein [Methylobacterium sp. JK268]
MSRVSTLSAPAGVGPYLRTLVLGSGARLFGLASQFVVLVQLGRILSRDQFGEMMIAFGAYRLIATALGVGGSLVLLYHVSRRPEDRAGEVRLHRFSLLLAFLLAGLLALGGALGAEALAAAVGKPGLAAWLRLLAPFGVLNTLLIVSTGALEGRSRISESILVGDVAPSATRMLLLPLAALAGFGADGVAPILTLSVLLPWLWAARGAWRTDVAGLRAWSRWDLGYGGKFVVATLLANQLGAIDLLVAGALFPSGTVADYAVASRIAGLYTFFQLFLLKSFAPRAAPLLERGDRAALGRDTETCRRLVVGCTALTIAGILLAAPLGLPLFGPYGGAATFLALLAIPSFTTAFYATSDRLLLIAGQANVLLLLTGSSCLTLVALPAWLAPVLGLAAVPGAMILSALLFNPIVASRARRVAGVATIRPRDAAALALGGAALALDAARGSAMTLVLAVVVLGGIAALYAGPVLRRGMPAG